MQTNDTNSCADVRTNNQIITPNPKHRAAYGRLQDALMQLEELKSVAWMLDETSNRLEEWRKSVSSVSLIHRQVCELSCTLDRIHDDLNSLFAGKGGVA